MKLVRFESNGQPVIGVVAGDGIIRISFVHYNTKEEVEMVISTLDEVLY